MRSMLGGRARWVLDGRLALAQHRWPSRMLIGGARPPRRVECVCISAVELHRRH